MALRRGTLEVAEDDVQWAGTDRVVHDGDETAFALEVYSAVEPGVKAIRSGLNLITNAQQPHAG
jgi:hypothetical protein